MKRKASLSYHIFPLHHEVVHRTHSKRIKAASMGMMDDFIILMNGTQYSETLEIAHFHEWNGGSISPLVGQVTMSFF
jgi:hypothetical protein